MLIAFAFILYSILNYVLLLYSVLTYLEYLTCAVIIIANLYTVYIVTIYTLWVIPKKFIMSVNKCYNKLPNIERQNLE